jgi:hypothetical protein
LKFRKTCEVIEACIESGFFAKEKNLGAIGTQAFTSVK